MEFLTENERLRAIVDEQARVREMISEFRASPEPLELRPEKTVMTFLHESIHTGGDAKDLKRTKVGGMILSASSDARRLILLAALKALQDAPKEAPSWEVNVIGNVRFVHDYHWGMLIKEILRSRPAATEDFVKGILERLSDLADRFDSYLPNSYEFPFSSLVRYVHKHIVVWSVKVNPTVKELLASIKDAVAHDLSSLKGYSKAKSKTLSTDPGQWFKKTDRDAIRLIESWVQL
jgi:hypothetical protein